MDIEDLGNTKEYQVISASRRTDIPAFYMDDVVEALKKKQIDVSALCKTQHTLVSLDPKIVKMIVWWSKDYSNWIEKYKENKKLFDKYYHMFNFTLTGGDELETGIGSTLDERFDQVKYLSKHFSPKSIIIRFDPIVYYKIIGKDKILNNMGKFEEIMKTISKFGIDRIVFSFCIAYPKVVNRFKKRGKVLVELSVEKKKEIIDDMIKICDGFNIRLETCCNTGLVGYKKKVFASACVNGDIIEELIGEKLEKNTKDKAQRKECNCCVSKDIGSYMMKCKHNCDYCYAHPDS